MTETTQHSTMIYNGSIIQVKKDQVILPNGLSTQREVVVHDPAVVIIPFKPPNTVYLVKQYRYAIQDYLIECPAGLIEKDEDPLMAARREMQEEVNLDSHHMIDCGGSYPTPGFCNEFYHFFIADQVFKSVKEGDADENCEILQWSVEEYKNAVMSRQISDTKTILGYFYLNQFLMEREGA